MGFYDTYRGALKDFLSALDTLSNARLTHYIIYPVTFERYLRTLLYDLLKMPLFPDMVTVTVQNYFGFFY